MADPKTFSQEEVDAIIAERDAIKANRDEALTEAKKAKAALKNYDGVDPQEFKALKDAAAEADRKKAAAEGDFETLKKQLVENHAKELGGRDAKIGKLTKSLERKAIRSELQEALVKAGAFKDELDLLTDYGEKFARMRETEEGFEAFIANEQGQPRVADGAGTPMNFAMFAEQVVKAKYPRLFEGSGSSGGGASKSNAGGGGAVTKLAVPQGGVFGKDFDPVAISKGTTVVE